MNIKYCLVTGIVEPIEIVHTTRTGFTFLLLVIAGIASVAMSAFGLFAAGWGGACEGSNTGEKVLRLLFWLLAALSTAAFISYFVSKKTGLLASWLIAIGSMIDILTINFDSCSVGDCTTKNPVLIALVVFLLPHIWILLAASLGLHFATSISRQSANSSEGESSKALN